MSAEPGELERTEGGERAAAMREPRSESGAADSAVGVRLEDDRPFPVARRLESVPLRIRVVATVASLLAYPIAFFPFFGVIGPVAWVVSYVPAIVAAVLLGSRGAIAVVAVEAVVNVWLAVETGATLVSALAVSVPGVASLLIVAAVIGQYRDLNVRLTREIEERTNTERHLRQTRKELAIVNRVVRHDIRNDMAITIGWGRELEDRVDGEAAEMLDRMLDNSQHVVELTESVRDFMAALERGPSELEPVDLASVLLDEIEKRDSAYRSARFVLDGELPDARVRANGLLPSVFRNLLNNAVQHNDADAPRVAVSVDETRDAVTVSVADNGPGIPDDRKDAVLGRDERGPDDPAAGIGLYLVDSLVAQYGGDVRIEDGEPRGAVFRVTLPKATDD